MDEKIVSRPKPSSQLEKTLYLAKTIYTKNFQKQAWFGRCIFLSWYCERGTCTFCFRSVTKHTISHPDKARRSLASILAEAMLIKGMGWRIEFLTGGYGIANDYELLRMVKLVSQILNEKIWLNLGEIGTTMLEELQPYVEGIVSSIETVEPKLHKLVCPDKPVEPFLDMMKMAKEKGFKLGMTIIIGLGEEKKDFDLLKEFIEDNNIDRITIYALRPVAQTPFTKGPESVDVAWWIAQTRIAFPKIEIIAGSAQYRIPELSLFLDAGANALTKLPATKMFNTKDGLRVEEEFKLAGRETQSIFHSENPKEQINWEEMLKRADITKEEREEVRIALNHYLTAFEKRA